MTNEDLVQKWPRAQFEEWQKEGYLSSSLTYETYLEFRRVQQAEAEQQIRELIERYGQPPGEQPPELSAEDERDLRAAWEETAAARAQNKNEQPGERLAA